MDKQPKVDPYSGPLPSNGKEQTTDTRSDMDESQEHYAEWKKPQWCFWSLVVILLTILIRFDFY